MATQHKNLKQLKSELEATVTAKAKAEQQVTALSNKAKRLRERISNKKQQQKAKRNVVIDANVVNQSERSGGVKPVIIVLHSTESDNRDGSSDLQGVVGWFNNPAAQASSHVITDADGNSARCVPDEKKAWHCAAFNSASLGIEQIGRASQKDWDDDELKETAAWIAHWADKWNIPLRRGAVSGSSVTKPGIVTHAQLGAAGGGHVDPGAGYPVDRVIKLAKEYSK